MLPTFRPFHPSGVIAACNTSQLSAVWKRKRAASPYSRQPNANSQPRGECDNRLAIGSHGAELASIPECNYEHD